MTARMQLIRVTERLEVNSRRPRHPRALDNQQLLAIEGSQKVRNQLGLNVRIDGVRKMPLKTAKPPPTPPA